MRVSKALPNDAFPPIIVDKAMICPLSKVYRPFWFWSLIIRLEDINSTVYKLLEINLLTESKFFVN